ncbi:MAG: GNAT family N-acetyltransferase [Pseudomonadota bacterium]
MTINLSFVSEVADTAELRALMVDFFKGIVELFEAAGGAGLSAQDLADGAIAHLDEILPPNGRLAMAHDASGRLIGCGAFRVIRPDAVEMKRMFVKPEAQGQGLGRRLFEMRIAEAKAMGCRAIYADTAKGNTRMLNMYERFGFQYISRYPENANPPELDPYLVYLEYQFPGT